MTRWNDKCNVRVKVFTGDTLQIVEHNINAFLEDLDEGQLIDVKIGRAGDMHSVMVMYRID